MKTASSRDEPRDPREDGGFAAAERGEHPVAEPADHRVQPPEVVDGGPGGLLPAALRDRLRHAVAVGGEREAPVLRGHLAGEGGEAVPQVLGRVERQRRGLAVRLEVECGISVPGSQAVEGCFAPGELVREEGQRGLWCGHRRRLRGGAVLAEEQREQFVALAALLRFALKALVKSLRVLSGGHGVGGELLLGLDVADVHEGRGVADVLVSLVVLLLEHLEDALVAADHRVRALRGQIDDPGGALLSVTVHPAVPLGEDHERPRHVEVDQPVAGVVEVDPLGSHVGTDEEAHRRLRLAEGFHHLLLFHVGHRAVERGELADAETEVARQPLPEPAEGLDPLGEEDEPVLRVGGPPVERLAAVDRGEEGLVLGEIAGPDAFHRRVEGAEGGDLGGDRRGFAAVAFALPASEAGLDGGAAGRRAGEERFLEGDQEEVAADGAGRRTPNRSPGRSGPPATCTRSSAS